MLILRGHLKLGGASSCECFLWRVSEVLILDLGQVELLWPQNGAGSGNSDPADKGLSIDLEVLHGVDANQRASAAETGLAVHGDCASIRLGKVCLTAAHELINDGLRWRRSVSEDHVLMVDALHQEGVPVVLGLVQADDLRHVQVLEDVDVARCGVAITMHGVALVDGTHEGQELAWDDPVQVAILDLLVVLVLASVERLEVVPSKSDSLLEAIQAVRNGAVVVAVATAGVAEGLEVGLVDLELAEGLLGIHLEDNNHESTHEVGRVSDLGELSALCIVVDACLTLEAVTLEQLLQLTAVAMRHGEVQRTEVFVERHVSQVLKVPKRRANKLMLGV